MSTQQLPDRTIKTPTDDPRHDEERLDEAIDESFPASDPVSISIDEPPPEHPRIDEPPPPAGEDDRGRSDPVYRAGARSAGG